MHTSKISGSYGSEYEDNCLLECSLQIIYIKLSDVTDVIYFIDL
jgi:hypothetical protein